MPDESLVRIGREMFLAALGLPLDRVDAWVIDRLTSIIDEQEIHAGQALFVAGAPVELIYFMRDGDVRFTRDGAPSWTLRGRWFLGVFDALNDRPATRTATALTDFYGMAVPVAAWVELLEDSFQLARSAVVNASRALMRLEERVPTEAPRFLGEASSFCAAPSGKLGLGERLALLLGVPMLRGTGVQALADLAAVSEQVGFAAGETLIERGGEREHLILVVDGDVLTEREGPEMRRHFGPGDLVCGAAILGGVADPWRARAITAIRGISFPMEALFGLMEEHFDLVRSTLTALGARRELLLETMASQASDLIVT
jgi:CRP-like cAMP-binding protein